MRISYNWLKEYCKTTKTPQEISELLTSCGLEVEAMEPFETIKGGLAGLVVGEVKTKEKHPDADRLSITTVDIGGEKTLQIVCGAANVATGQKVVVATVGSVLYPIKGESFEIKKSKIRGVLSEGMICAEDEIGLGSSHDGILVLDSATEVGTAVANYFNIESDCTFEIGLTPNRSDATSHIGVARDLVAIINSKNPDLEMELTLPDVRPFRVDNTENSIQVILQDDQACPRYSGITVSGIEVKESPEWLKTKLQSIGLKCINNVVDVTNFVLHETGQPLHAFDADRIAGKTILVKTLTKETPFTTLDGVERKLNETDLMICNEKEPMCIAGVYGGVKSGVTERTKNIFIESAYFNSSSIRKTAKFHGLKTDASFRYERGCDPNITVYALKRAALLIKQIAGGNISSDIIDLYPKPIEPAKVSFSYKNCDAVIGKEIPHTTIKNILLSLGIKIESEGGDALLLSIPSYKTDVTREVDVIEEVLRIYGCDNIEIPEHFHFASTLKNNNNNIKNTAAEILCNNGFNEIMSTSLTKSSYLENEKNTISILNSLSSDLNSLRPHLLYSGLEAIAYNQNRKNSNVKFFEFGKTYLLDEKNDSWKYKEELHLALFISGNKIVETWNVESVENTIYTIKGYAELLLEKLGLKITEKKNAENDQLIAVFEYYINKKNILTIGKVKSGLLKRFDIKQDVFYADFNWSIIQSLLKNKTLLYQPMSKFPEVRRDLALLIDKSIKFEQLEQLALQTEKKLLKKVSVFDVYEGNKLDANKKSYALSFTLQNQDNTLSDEQIEGVMSKLQKAFEEKVGAVIR